MGAEIGNSTQKLHARGPIGLRELCTFKYLVEGDGPGPRPDARRRVRLGSSAGRSTRRTRPPRLRAGGARRSSGSTACVLRAGRTRRRTRRPRPTRAPSAARAVPARGGGRRAPRRVARSRSTAGPRPTRSIPCGSCMTRRPEDELTFIVGGDMAQRCPTWREPEARPRARRLAVAERDGRPPRRHRSSACAGCAARPSACASSTCRASTSRPRSIRRRVADGPADPLPRARRRRRARSQRAGCTDDARWPASMTLTPRAARRPRSPATPPTRRRSTSSSSTCAACSATPTSSSSAPATPTARPRRSTTASTRGSRRTTACCRAASRALTRGALDPHGLPRRGRPRLHARGARLLPPRAALGRGARDATSTDERLRPRQRRRPPVRRPSASGARGLEPPTFWLPARRSPS